MKTLSAEYTVREVRTCRTHLIADPLIQTSAIGGLIFADILQKRTQSAAVCAQGREYVSTFSHPHILAREFDINETRHSPDITSIHRLHSIGEFLALNILSFDQTHCHSENTRAIICGADAFASLFPSCVKILAIGFRNTGTLPRCRSGGGGPISAFTPTGTRRNSQTEKNQS